MSSSVIIVLGTITAANIQKNPSNFFRGVVFTLRLGPSTSQENSRALQFKGHKEESTGYHTTSVEAKNALLIRKWKHNKWDTANSKTGFWSLTVVQNPDKEVLCSLGSFPHRGSTKRCKASTFRQQTIVEVRKRVENKWILSIWIEFAKAGFTSQMLSLCPASLLADTLSRGRSTVWPLDPFWSSKRVRVWKRAKPVFEKEMPPLRG